MGIKRIVSALGKHPVKNFAVLGSAAFLIFAFNNCANNFSPSGGDGGNTSQNDPGDGGDFVDNRPTTCQVPAITVDHSPNFVANATEKVFVDLAKYPLAVCNDGSPVVFAIRPGFGVAKNRWVIFLEGGASCYDKQSCTDRANETPNLLSSNFYKTNPLGTGFGVLSPDPNKNSTFYDATVVNVHYCSSDMWSGDKAGDANKPGVIPDSWHFRGHEIVKAVIHTLQDKYELNNASELLLAGSSAGGIGVFGNLGWVSQNIPASVRFVAMNDAGFPNEVAGYDVNEADGVSKAPGTPYDTLNPLQQALWNETGDYFCEKKAVTQQDHIQCLIGPVIAAKDTGTLRVPMFVRQALADGVQLKQEGLDIQSNPPKQQSQGYQAFFAQTMREKLQGTNNFVSYFAQASNVHGQVDNSDFYLKSYTFGTVPNQVTLTINQALGIWYPNPCQLNGWMQ